MKQYMILSPLITSDMENTREMKFIIRKIDRENFLIFNEYVVDGRRNTSNYTYMNKIDLLDDVNHYVNKQGYKLKHSY
jgi:hypothetical protein